MKGLKRPKVKERGPGTFSKKNTKLRFKTPSVRWQLQLLNNHKDLEKLNQLLKEAQFQKNTYLSERIKGILVSHNIRISVSSKPRFIAWSTFESHDS